MMRSVERTISPGEFHCTADTGTGLLNSVEHLSLRPSSKYFTVRHAPYGLVLVRSYLPDAFGSSSDQAHTHAPAES
jgi:hypothetical protein